MTGILSSACRPMDPPGPFGWAGGKCPSSYPPPSQPHGGFAGSAGGPVLDTFAAAQGGALALPSLALSWTGPGDPQGHLKL